MQLKTVVHKFGIGAEIGVWRGQHAEQLLNDLEPSKLYLVDPWIARDESDYKGALYGPGISQEIVEANYNLVQSKFSNNSIIEINREFSFDWFKKQPEDCLDWVYIDGDHNYNSVRQDLHGALKCVRPGGFITGDDYQCDGWWGNGVRQAVDEFRYDLRWQIDTISLGTPWILRIKTWADRKSYLLQNKVCKY